jgi:hypothetical protein
MCGCVVVWVGVCVGVYTKSKTSELSPLRRKLLRFAKQFPPPLRSNYKEKRYQETLRVNFDWTAITKYLPSLGKRVNGINWSGTF